MTGRLVFAAALVLAATTTWTSARQDANSSTTASIVDGVFTPDQASRGGLQFKQTCTACHTVSEHAGPKFAGRWKGSTMGDLFDFVSNTMPEGDPGSLKPEEYASILAFFLNESGYKNGEKELPSDLESLKKIRVEPLP